MCVTKKYISSGSSGYPLVTRSCCTSSPLVRRRRQHIPHKMQCERALSTKVLVCVGWNTVQDRLADIAENVDASGDGMFERGPDGLARQPLDMEPRVLGRLPGHDDDGWTRGGVGRRVSRSGWGGGGRGDERLGGRHFLSVGLMCWSMDVSCLSMDVFSPERPRWAAFILSAWAGLEGNAHA